MRFAKIHWPSVLNIFFLQPYITEMREIIFPQEQRQLHFFQYYYTPYQKVPTLIRQYKTYFSALMNRKGFSEGTRTVCIILRVMSLIWSLQYIILARRLQRPRLWKPRRHCSPLNYDIFHPKPASHWTIIEDVIALLYTIPIIMGLIEMTCMQSQQKREELQPSSSPRNMVPKRTAPIAIGFRIS